ncbi:hypothetical protein CHU32_20505 [Superficieibacter electus]|uniref:Uncharacterized protein n=1 Tax=Superficieibacter electus TaxID=2022662 RepID=A0A2P5GKQ5_9ENTR|nr:hypothetical protein [Superficieibacter electus]POP42531.1 hypothetical protein CHU33_19490 [Superficieibacter electus]POP45145.1 hypothetical protein CHU32_20505 [Superficieibacter electus]
MKIQQQMKLKKLMGCFERDYQLSEQLYTRHVELIDAAGKSGMESSFERSLLSAGVRPEILATAMESAEFEETMTAMVSALTGIIGRWDMADRLDSERNAA